MKSDTISERAFRRRLAILSLLHARPYSFNDLIAALEQQLLETDAFTGQASDTNQQKEMFRRDLKALRVAGCNIRHDRRTNCYIWHNSPFGLAFNPAQLSAFSVLLTTFAKTTIPQSFEVQELLNYLTSQLPADQQRSLNNSRRPFIIINLRETTDYREADPATVAEIEKAIRRGQQLEFRYISPRDGKERPHIIEPRPLVFEKGHVYLRGWSIPWNQELPFRLDKIVAGSAKMLPSTIAPVRPSATTYCLRYWLSPTLARQGVSQYYEGQQVERYADGSAIVTATVTHLELFEASRRLLGYGLNCRVLEPPHLVAEMREIVSNLHQFYCT